MPEWNAAQSRLAELMLKRLHLEVPSPDTDLVEAGLLDSLSFVDLLLVLEQEFGLAFTLQEIELEHFRSLARMADFISARQQV